MNVRFWTARLAIAVATVAAAACAGSNARRDVSRMYVEVATSDGFQVNADCVERVLGAMSDRDVRALQTAGLDGAPNLSANGLRTLTDVANQCVDVGEYVEAFVARLATRDDVGAAIDADCVRKRLGGLSSIDEVDRASSEALAACGGGSPGPTTAAPR